MSQVPAYRRKRKPINDGKIKLTIRLAPALHKNFKQIALDHDTSVVRMVEGATKYWIAQGCPTLPGIRTPAAERRAIAAAAEEATVSG
jgi:hypothetical protein